MKLFNDFLADLSKKHAGSLYRPSNGTEADMFFCIDSGECHGCVYKTDELSLCLTEILSFALNVSDDMYPIELQIDHDGQPVCKRKSAVPMRNCNEREQ